jgi:hypothetical protein
LTRAIDNPGRDSQHVPMSSCCDQVRALVGGAARETFVFPVAMYLSPIGRRTLM